MIWPFRRTKNGTETQSIDPTPEEVAAEAADTAARKVRRVAAQKRIVAALRDARDAREQTLCVEAEHVKTTNERRKKAETASRQAQEKATEVCDTLSPVDRAASAPAIE